MHFKCDWIKELIENEIIKIILLESNLIACDQGQSARKCYANWNILREKILKGHEQLSISRSEEK